nr:hypothetical protein CFP56_38226 [Quercus suber]
MRSSSKGAITERRTDQQVEIPAWSPAMVLDGAPLLSTTSIKDFQHGKARYVAKAIEQALLLPADMAGLKGMRSH